LSRTPIPALAFAAFDGTVDVLQQVLVAAVLIATGTMVEPQPTLRRSDRRSRHAVPHAVRSAAVPA
jgi:hypothetical protein